MTLILVKVDVKKISKKFEGPGPDIKINKAGDRKKYSVKSPLSSSLLLISKMPLLKLSKCWGSDTRKKPVVEHKMNLTVFLSPNS